MKILTTSVADQTIRIIPRSYPDDITIIVRDDSTNTETTYTLDSMEWENSDEEWQTVEANWNSAGGYYEENDYLVITNQYALVEGRFYDLTIKNELNKVIYKDKIFCTDQTIDESTNNYYTVNQNEYTVENTYDNDYIIL
jgi:hypothetical protein